MLSQVGSGVQFIKDYNELNVIRFIKNHAPVSRAEIAKRYHLSKAAVSDIISRLITQGYVSEIGVGHSTSRGGRRPIMLKFNSMAGFVIAVEIKRSYARIALLDMEAEIKQLKTVAFTEGSSFETVTDVIFPEVSQFLDNDWVRKAKPIGIGIGMPGIIDYDAGCVKISDTLHKWQNVPVVDLFSDRFGMNVVLENDVKAFTLGECLFGQVSSCRNLVNLWIGDGIGAGIIINGLLIRGATASAGEIGYDELGFFIRDAHDFPLLYRGQKDFGDILSNKLLLQAASEAIESEQYQTCLKMQNLSLHGVAHAAEKSDPLAVELFREYANILGILCINLVNTLNIDTLILSGPLVSKSDILLQFVRDQVHKDILREPAQAVKIVAATLNDLGVIKGAAGLVLEDLFYQESINIHKYRSIFKEYENRLP
jgi:predicted NBD/HSP70 family sugar kinase